MTDPISRPLWRVMHDAYWKTAGMGGDIPPACTGECFAAELRAIADWLVPEPDADCIVPGHGQYLYDLLLAEVDRAEAGE
jgi:hypothetical protein